ncbi:PREDICTED: uncharacterized protein LOC109174703 [Ipomoea nil]|uniref:uncharacterized protein LOC109174703 n=1 Tax=Ipomoea nil TaxID=35883 RepID=UPI000901DD4C|nr:PREDICTED: uncharacterized protein LOC109174703 [Ipomoea nil]
MEAKIAELLKWKEGGGVPIPKIEVTPPFTRRIIREPIPSTFKPPSITRFDGRGDPQEHIMAYQATMMLMGSSEAMMCRAFFSTLIGQAQRWFTSLKGGTVDSFHDLAVKFITHFMRGRKIRKHFTHLTTVKQGVGESLTDFLARWRAEEANVENIDDKSGVVMFVDALRAGDLYKSLRCKTPDTYAALMAKADRYAEAEEANRLKGREEEIPGKRSRPTEEPVRPGKRGANPAAERAIGGRGADAGEGTMTYRAPPPWAPRPPMRSLPTAPLTPINARPSEVLVYAEQCQMVKFPEPRAPSIPAEGRGRYCRFHRRPGHNTDECQAWRKEIEALIQSGHLGNFIDWSKMYYGNVWRRETAEVGPESPNPPKGRTGGGASVKGKRPVINVIFGEWSAGKREEEYVGSVERTPAVKRQRKEPITFTNTDLPRGGASSKEAMVIAMEINGTIVRRVLLDTGSSVNVMYHDIFVKLGFAQDQLKPIKTPLAGFTGDTVETEGMI